MSKQIINTVIEKYKKQFYQYGRTGTSLFAPKDRNQERFSSIEKFIPYNKDSWTILDYGCGFGNLNQHLQKVRKDSFVYYGVDAVEEFINSNKKFEPEINYRLINSYNDIQINYDYIVIVGVFNMLYSCSTEEHKQLLKNTIEHLFSKCNRWIAINFMTDKVDYVQESAYHQSPIEIYNYALDHLSSRVIIDQSYLPYEFTLIIYKDQKKSPSDKGMYLNEFF